MAATVAQDLLVCERDLNDLIIDDYIFYFLTAVDLSQVYENIFYKFSIIFS